MEMELDPLAEAQGPNTHVNPLKRKRVIPPLATSSRPESSSSSRQPPLRANRACNTCRRQKMRCDSVNFLPCSRCKTSGVECVFAEIPRGPSASTSSRVDSLERKMKSVQDAIVQLNGSVQQVTLQLRYLTQAQAIPLSKDTQGHIRPLLADVSSSTTSASEGALSLQSKQTEEGQNLPSSVIPTHSIQPLISPAPTPPTHSLIRTSKPFGHHNLQLHRTEPLFVPTSRPSSAPPLQLAPIRGPSAYFEAHLLQPGSSTSNSNTERVSEDLPHHVEFNIHVVPSSSNDRQKSHKRRYLDARNVLREDSGNGAPEDYIKEFQTEDRQIPDPIDKGLLTENEARRLFSLFFERCHPRMPILDPKIDDFQSLREYSPFCFTCVLMVAAKAQDGGNKPSALHLSLWDEAMLRAKESMFTRVKDLAVIQGLLLLSAWSEVTGGTSWILAGHAIRCGVELGIHKSLGKLMAETIYDEDAVGILVSSARIWCALFAFEHQLSLGIGRFSMTGNAKTVKNARRTLLNHPLSNPFDMRLVSACEIMSLEYQILDALPGTDANDPRCQAILKDGRDRMDVWYTEWDSMLSAHFPPEHYMRQTIAVQRGYGYMTVHLACMPLNAAIADAAKLSPPERENCIRAVSASRDIVRITVEEKSYRDGIQYSPPCFVGGVSFVGALTLQLGCILPGEVTHNLLLAEELSQVLRDVPTCRFKTSFLTLLREQQQKNAYEAM